MTNLLPLPEPVRGYEGKLATVTGATGLIGSHVVEILKASGARVRAICHDRPENDLTRLADVVCRFDLSSQADAVAAVMGSDVVLSCAGITGGVGLAAADPVSFVGPATAMAINTLHACHLAGVPQIGFLSSTTVYAPSERPVVEGDVALPAPLYPLYRGIGESKRFMERLLAYYEETAGIRSSVVRPSGAYGRHDNFDLRTSHVLPAMVVRALALGAGEPFEVWGDGEDVRDFVHARDVARGLLLATSYPRSELVTRLGPVNIASGVGVTTAGLARAVLEAVGKAGTEIALRPDKPSALRSRRVDSSKARMFLGWRQEVSLEAGIADVVQGLREQGACR